jgi:hypothetical protein
MKASTIEHRPTHVVEDSLNRVEDYKKADYGCDQTY